MCKATSEQVKIVPGSESIGLSKVLEDMTSAWKKMGGTSHCKSFPPTRKTRWYVIGMLWIGRWKRWSMMRK